MRLTVDKSEKPKEKASGMFKRAAVASTLMVAAIMPLKTNAEESPKDEKQVQKNIVEDKRRYSFRIMGGVYDMGETGFVGAGMSAGFDIGPVSVDMIADGIFSNFQSMELDLAELDITIPIADWMTLTPYVYRSRYYDVDLGAGATFSFPDANLHMAAEWCCQNLMPVTVFWTPSMCDGKVNVMLKAVVIANYAALGEVTPTVGGEIKVSAEISKGVSVYAKIFEMTINDHGNWSAGIVNAQAGVEMSP